MPYKHFNPNTARLPQLEKRLARVEETLGRLEEMLVGASQDPATRQIQVFRALPEGCELTEAETEAFR
jgi:uncharacterized coiled-coil protein SlyX